MFKLKRKTKNLYFNINTDSRLIKVYLSFLDVSLFKIKEYFLCTKSNYQKEIEKQNEEYRNEQRLLLYKY